MRNHWVAIAAMLVMLGGCASDDTTPPPSAACPRTVKKSPLAADDLSAAQPDKLPAESKPAEKKPVYRTTDDFGLPLVIEIDAPEPPAEILGPSPPIEEEEELDKAS